MSKFNRGDVSEGILAAAITARFLSKTKRVTDTDVTSVIRKLARPVNMGSKGLTSTSYFTSANENPKINDEVCCVINLAENNMDALRDLKIYQQKDIREIVTASAAFANGMYVMQWADLMYTNNQKNKIEVLSEGLMDQTGTKVDLKIRIDDKPCSIGISLKYGDVKQFGQVGGSSFESMKSLFEPLGVTFSKIFENKYTEKISKKDISGSLTMAYEEAVTQMNKKQQKVLLKHLADFMKYHATLNEDDVALVQLNRSEAGVYDFGKLEQKLMGQEVELEMTEGITEKLTGYTGSNKIPKINFRVKANNEILFSIRLKLEGNRINSKGKRLPLVVRNYIEKGKATTQLLMENA